MSRFEKLLVILPSLLFVFVISAFIFNFQRGKTVTSTVNETLNFTKETIDAVESTGALNINDTPVSEIFEDIYFKIEDLTTTTASLTKRVEILEENYQNTATTVSTTTIPFQKQIIYIGSTSTNKLDWIDTGVEVTLNSSDYPSGIDVVFEAGLSSVGGIAYARLLNKTTGSIMAITEISHNTSTTTWKTSPTFKLFSGSNMYTLQMKSSSGETVNVSGSRVVIGQ